MLLFFYYPSAEYISWLMTVEELTFYDEIDCRDLFPGNDSREQIVIFTISTITDGMWREISWNGITRSAAETEEP